MAKRKIQAYTEEFRKEAVKRSEKECQHRSKTSGFHRSKTAGFRQKYIRSQRLLFLAGLSSGMNLLPG